MGRIRRGIHRGWRRIRRFWHRPRYGIHYRYYYRRFAEEAEKAQVAEQAKFFRRLWGRIRRGIHRGWRHVRRFYRRVRYGIHRGYYHYRYYRFAEEAEKAQVAEQAKFFRRLW